MATSASRKRPRDENGLPKTYRQDLEMLLEKESMGENKWSVLSDFIELQNQVIMDAPDYVVGTSFNEEYNGFREELIGDILGLIVDNAEEDTNTTKMVYDLTATVQKHVLIKMDDLQVGTPKYIAAAEQNHNVCLQLINLVLTDHAREDWRTNENILHECRVLLEKAKTYARIITAAGFGGIGEHRMIEYRNDQKDAEIEEYEDVANEADDVESSNRTKERNEEIEEAQSQVRVLTMQKANDQQELVTDKDLEVRNFIDQEDSKVNALKGWEAGNKIREEKLRFLSPNHDEYRNLIIDAIDHYRTACTEAVTAGNRKLMVRVQCALADMFVLLGEQQRAVALYKPALHTAAVLDCNGSEWEKDVDVYCPAEAPIRAGSVVIPRSRTGILHRQCWFQSAKAYAEGALADVWVQEAAKEEADRARFLEQLQPEIAAIRAAAQTNPRFGPNALTNVVHQLEHIYKTHPPKVHESDPVIIARKHAVGEAFERFHEKTDPVQTTVKKTLVYMKFFYSGDHNSRFSNDVKWLVLCEQISLILNDKPSTFPRKYTEAIPKSKKPEVGRV